MKKVFLLMILALIAMSLFAFTACGNDSDTYADDPAVSETEDGSGTTIYTTGKAKKMEGKIDLYPITHNDTQSDYPENIVLAKEWSSDLNQYTYTFQFDSAWYEGLFCHTLYEADAKSIKIKFDSKNYLELTFKDIVAQRAVESGEWNFADSLLSRPANAHYVFHVSKGQYYEELK